MPLFFIDCVQWLFSNAKNNNQLWPHISVRLESISVYSKNEIIIYKVNEAPLQSEVFLHSKKIAVSPVWFKLAHFAWIGQTTQHLLVETKDLS